VAVIWVVVEAVLGGGVVKGGRVGDDEGVAVIVRGSCVKVGSELELMVDGCSPLFILIHASFL
jgi:hypothetical protein